MIKRIIFSGWFLGLAIAVPVILLLPDLFNRYKVSLILQETAAQPVDYRIFFSDLDGNGIKQKIYAFRNQAGQLACQYFGDNGGIINQINFRNKFSRNVFALYFGDVNKNGKPEIYGFTLNQDSLFLNMAELVHPYGDKSETLFITRIGTFDDVKIDYTVSRFSVIDLDNDGNNEIVFSIVTGFSKFPRIVVIYHPDTGQLLKSKDIGINPYFPVFYDLEQDGKTEILIGSNAGFNLNDSTGSPYPDNRPYLVAYDSHLNLLWPPVAFSAGIDNNIHILINDQNQTEIVAFQFNRSRATEKMIGIYTIDTGGNVKDSLFLPKYGKRFKFQLFEGKNGFWLYAGDKMVKINYQLEVVDEKIIEVSSIMRRNPVIQKGSPEFATSDLHSENVCIYTENFDHKVKKVYVDEKVKDIFLETGKGADYFMVQTDSNEYTYHFQKNWLWYVKFPVYLLIYLLSVLFVWLIQQIREKQLNERYELQNQLRNLEIKSLRMQMDPHFMFNTFNSMALLLKSGDREEAVDAFMKFTRMVRLNFDFSDQFTRQLSEEIDIVRQYLELNKLRFKEKLEFRIQIDQDVPQNMLIPKMALQIHVENALKHGLSRLEKTGIIQVILVREEEILRVTIEDNGIGRQKAAQMNTGSTRQGLKMLMAMYDRLNQSSKTKITQEVTDLKDENQHPAGTRVEIRIPFSLKETQAV